MSDDVIIVSGPKRVPPASRIRRITPASNKRAARPLQASGSSIIDLGAVIQISDSEDELPCASSSKNKLPDNGSSSQTINNKNGKVLVANGGGGSSRNFLQPIPAVADNKPSQAASLQNRRQIPLFLPSDEENDPPEPHPQPLQNAQVNQATLIMRENDAIERHGQLFLDDDTYRRLVIPEIEPSPPPSLEPTPPLEARDPMDEYVARVLEIIPDVTPEHVHSLIETHVATYGPGVVEQVLHTLFEDPTYPKTDKKGKRKAAEPVPEDHRGQPKLRFDYASKDRAPPGSRSYFELALEHLQGHFPYIPKPHVRKALLEHNHLYAPTYFFLAAEAASPHLPYRPKQIPYRATGKGRAFHDPEFEQEHEWLLQKLATDMTKKDEVAAQKMNEDQYSASGDGIECGCCFTDYPFDKMIQCPEAHLFCTDCMTTYTSTLLGTHDSNIICMDQSGCKLPFPTSELQRFLPEKLWELYERVTQRKEIEAAGLEGLEECPFCEYKVVIENESEKLFRCENTDCGAVTCRSCKKPDHLPKTCKEADKDKVLDAQHAVEEAMTRALMRNCPKCQKAFIKEHGCNKMTCPNCQTLSCYVCRQIIKGYDHFNQQPGAGRQPAASSSQNKCQLWDSVEHRHADEVKAAAERAMEELKRANPEVDADEIMVDIPKGPQQPAPDMGGFPNIPLIPQIIPQPVPRPVLMPALPPHRHIQVPALAPPHGPGHRRQVQPRADLFGHVGMGGVGHGYGPGAVPPLHPDPFFAHFGLGQEIPGIDGANGAGAFNVAHLPALNPRVPVVPRALPRARVQRRR